jgi:hypothetical protein
LDKPVPWDGDNLIPLHDKRVTLSATPPRCSNVGMTRWCAPSIAARAKKSPGAWPMLKEFMRTWLTEVQRHHREVGSRLNTVTSSEPI